MSVCPQNLVIKANTSFWKTDTLIAHLKTDLRMDRLCQNNVNEWLITQWIVWVQQGNVPPGGQKGDALFSFNASPCDVSLPVYVFLSLMLKSPLLSFSSPARADETLTALTSSLVAPLKLHFLFPECRWCGDVECADTDERASISTVWQLSTQHINHTDGKMQVWTSSLF